MDRSQRPRVVHPRHREPVARNRHLSERAASRTDALPVPPADKPGRRARSICFAEGVRRRVALRPASATNARRQAHRHRFAPRRPWTATVSIRYQPRDRHGAERRLKSAKKHSDSAPRRNSRVLRLARIIHATLGSKPVCHCLPQQRLPFRRGQHCLRPLRTANPSGKQCGRQVQQ